MAMTLRLSEAQTEQLRQLAADEGVSMQALAVRAIEQYAANRSTLRDRLLAEIVAENAEVLRRLG